MSENTAIENVNVAQELSANPSSIACSIQGGTMKEKAQVYNAMNNPDHKVGDFINKVINVQNYLCEQIELTNEETGEIKTAVRTVLIDDKGKSYQGVSGGIFNALKKAIAIFGAAPWDDPLPCEIKQVNVGKGSMLTFDIKL